MSDRDDFSIVSNEQSIKIMYKVNSSTVRGATLSMMHQQTLTITDPYSCHMDYEQFMSNTHANSSANATKDVPYSCHMDYVEFMSNTQCWVIIH